LFLQVFSVAGCAISGTGSVAPRQVYRGTLYRNT